MIISGDDRSLLLDAWLGATTKNELDIFIGITLDRDTKDFIPDGTRREQIWFVITYIDRQQNVMLWRKVLSALLSHQEYSLNQALQRVCQRILNKLPIAETAADAGLIDPTSQHLRAFAERFASWPQEIVAGREKLVAPNLPFIDVDKWREKLHRIMRSIAIVEVGANGEKGTGFNVGDNLVLTNFHVVKDLMQGSFPLDAQTATDCVHFDNYAANGERLPKVVRPLQNPWCLQFSPEAELDFALVQIEST